MEETKIVNKKDLHDLKSGLTAVIGYIQLAQKKAEKANEEELGKIIELLNKAIESANTLEFQIRKLEGINEPLIDL
jgi:uncharacterized FlaG/YvyC family protein